MSMWDKINRDDVKRMRQQARRRASGSRKNPSGGKSKAGGFWKKEIRIKGPRQDASGSIVPGNTEIVRLVPGNYQIPEHVKQDYPSLADAGAQLAYTQVEYYHPGIGRFGAQVPDTRDRENGRDLSRWLIESGRDEISARLFTYYSVLHLGYWHDVPAEKEIYDRETGGKKTITVKDAEPCAGKRGCKHCDNGLERIAGRAAYIRLSPQITECLDAIDDKVSHFCRCGCTSPLTAVQALCSSCGTVLAEAEYDDNIGACTNPITTRTIGDLYDRYTKCPDCHAPFTEVGGDGASISEVLVCDNDACPEPARACIFDADLALKKEGLGPKVRLVLDTAYFDARGFRVRGVTEAMAKVAEVFDFASDLPNTLAYVARRLNIPPQDNPYYEAPEGARRR